MLRNTCCWYSAKYIYNSLSGRELYALIIRCNAGCWPYLPVAISTKCYWPMDKHSCRYYPKFYYFTNCRHMVPMYCYVFRF